MPEIQHFLLFMLAVVHQYIVLAAGGVLTVMIALIERHVLKKQISYKAEIFVLLIFLFFACFGAWNEQYKLAKPPETAIQVNIPPQPSPQIQVNVPAPVVNLPPEMAYIASTDISVLANQYRIGGIFAVNAVCKNISPSVVAMNVACIRGLRVVDTKLNPQQQPIVLEKTQEEVWNQFQKDARSIPTTRMTYGPLESKLGSVVSPTVDESMDASFRSGTKTVMYLGEYTWTDGTGNHVDDVCTWLEMYPGLCGITVPTTMDLEAEIRIPHFFVCRSQGRTRPRKRQSASDLPRLKKVQLHSARRGLGRSLGVGGSWA